MTDWFCVPSFQSVVSTVHGSINKPTIQNQRGPLYRGGLLDCNFAFQYANDRQSYHGQETAHNHDRIPTTRRRCRSSVRIVTTTPRMLKGTRQGIHERFLFHAHYLREFFFGSIGYEWTIKIRRWID
jgi:hypothetical protein